VTVDFWLWRYAGNPVIWGILALALFCFGVEFHLLLAERSADWRRQTAIWLRVLPVLTGAVPLLGLVGTVSGMITTFKLMTIFGSSDANTLSAGISEAMITTKLGLVVAVPALIAHAFMTRRVKTYFSELENLGVGRSQLPLLGKKP